MATSIPIQSLACRRLCQYSLHGSSPSRHALARQLPAASRSFTTSRAHCQSVLRGTRAAAAGKDGHYRRKANLAAAGLSATLLATYALLTHNDVKLDAPSNVPDFTTSPIVNPSEDRHTEQIPTGTSTIPTFPKFIHVPTTEPPEAPGVLKQAEEEYQLVGLGIRTVSFLGIQVYVVGLYIAVADIAVLQERLIRLVDPVATALVPGERQTLRALLTDPEKGDQVWSGVLKHEGLRTAVRIVPTRNTDFMHLRDGWVRGITGRTQRATQAGNSEFDNESFGEAVRDFKGVFGGGARKSVPKGQTLLLARGPKGAMTAWYNEDGKPMVQLGAVTDERISRLVWLGYLAGKTVASEGTRQSIVDGVMEYVERPVGTVAAQVV